MIDAPEHSTRRVLEAIRRHLGVDIMQLRGRDRTAPVVGARWVAAVLLRMQCRLTFREIGRELGRRHQTVQHAVKLARIYPRTRELVEFVERQLEQENLSTRRAVVDVEELFRRAREDAGAPPSNLPRIKPR